MKKSLLTLVFFAYIFGVNSQPLSAAKEVEVSNYKEVVSQIVYPKVCKEKGIEGTVIVSLEINKQGKLVNHEFISSPCSDLKTAVDNAITKLKFSPAIDEAGQTISSRITMPVKFELSI